MSTPKPWRGPPRWPRAPGSNAGTPTPHGTDLTGGTYLHASNTLHGKYLHVGEYFFRIGNQKGWISVPLRTESPQIQGQAKNASNLLPEKSSMTCSKANSRRKALKLRVVVDRFPRQSRSALTILLTRTAISRQLFPFFRAHRSRSFCYELTYLGATAWASEQPTSKISTCELPEVHSAREFPSARRPSK
jgi:hypothetical protein